MGYGPTLWAHQHRRHLSRCPKGKFANHAGDIHPLTDQIADQPPPTINMLQIGRCLEASLHTILEESPDSESQGSTKTVTEIAAIQPPFPPF